MKLLITLSSLVISSIVSTTDVKLMIAELAVAFLKVTGDVGIFETMFFIVRILLHVCLLLKDNSIFFRYEIIIFLS